MANDRRGGVGFGGGQGPNDYDDFDEEIESTRAMDLVDDLDQETAMPQRMPMPPSREPPPAARPAPARPRAPAPPPPRPASAPPAAQAYGGPPKTLHDPDAFGGGANEDATRMLDSEALAAVGIQAPAPSGASALPIELRVISGPDRGKVHKLSEGEHLVGRGLDCHIVLADPAVSRKHFRLVRRGDDVEVIDMGGANGTNVNGERTSRKMLRSGDQIELGTSVLEYHVPGAAVERSRDFPQGDSGVPRSPAIRPAKGKSNTGLVIGLAIAALLVLVGGAVAAWLVMGSSSSAPTEEAAKTEGGTKDIAKLIEEAKGLLEDRDWAGAIDKLKAAREIDKDDAEVKGLLAKARGEVDAEEAITEGKELAKKGDLAAAIARFKEVATDSEQYADAHEELNAAREDLARERLAAARKAFEDGDKTAALAAVQAVLAVDDKHQEAKLLLGQIETMTDTGPAAAAKPDEAAPAAAKDEDKPKEDDKAAKAPKDDDKGGGPSAKALFAAAMTAYHNREWSAANAALTQIVDGGFSRKDKAKAAEDRDAVKEVADGMQQGEANAASPQKAARAWNKAYKADRRLDRHHSAAIVKKLGSAWGAAADQLFKAKRYGEAKEAADEAMNFDPDNQNAMDIADKCREAAKQMLKDAEKHLKEKNYATARDLARKVTQILGMMDPDSQKARDIALKATEASSGGDED